MKYIIRIITMILLFSGIIGSYSLVSGQSLSPRVMVTGGGYATGGGQSFSWTMGETFTTTLTAGTLILTQGEQQPEMDLLTGSISPLSYCSGATVTVPYTAKGYYGSTNVFTAQLSDASGLFTSPVNIGSATGPLNGTITATIPGPTIPGSNYRIRVVSSHPTYIGRDNLSNITVTASCCAISLSGVVTHVLCHNGSNGSINVSSSNTSGVPSYVWNNGSTSEDRSVLTAGTYTVTVSYGPGCSQMQSFVVTQPNTLVLNATPANITCRGAANGSITLAPEGNTPPYTYLWNNGSTIQNRTGLAPGTYTVTVNDAGLCGSMSQSFAITQPATSLIINVSKTNVRCNGVASGSASVSPAGGIAPYTYSWNTIPVNTTASVTGLAAGVYSCSVTDFNACTKTTIITITEPPPINVVPSQTNVTFPGGNNGTASVAVSGGTPGYTYSWNTVPVKTTSSVTGLTAGTYKCTVIDSKGCPVKITFIITQPFARTGGTTSDNNSWELVVYPNPSNGIFTISMIGIDEGESIRVKLVDVSGRIIYEMEDAWNRGEERLFDFSTLANGIYYLHCKTKDKSIIQKIVKQ